MKTKATGSGSCGSNLKAMCMAAGIGQAELAREARMNADTIRAAERDGGAVKELTRNKIMNAFNRLVSERHETTIDKMFPPK